MQISRQDIDDLNAMVSIKIEPADYQAGLKKSINDLSKKVQLKGFRKGKVPAGIVRKMHGSSLLADELNNLLIKAINDYIKENEIQILGRPLPKENSQQNIDIEAEKEYEFIYELGIAPKVDLGFLEGKASPKFTRHVVKVEDKVIQEEIDGLKKRFGKLEESDKIKSDQDVVEVKFEETDGKGTLKADGIIRSTTVPMDIFKGKTLLGKLKKLKKEDSIELNLYKSMDREKDAINKQILGLLPEEVDDCSGDFMMSIKNIKHLSPAELNQEFFDQVFGSGTVEDEKAFMERMEKQLEDAYASVADQGLNNEIIETIMEKVDAPLPDAFLKKYIAVSNEKPVSSDQIDEEYDQFAKGLRWTLVRNKLVKEAELKVEVEEVKDLARRDLEMRMRQYGQQNMPAEQLEQLVGSMLQDEKYRERLFESEIDRKVVQHLKEKVKIVEKSIDLEEFNQLHKR